MNIKTTPGLAAALAAAVGIALAPTAQATPAAQAAPAQSPLDCGTASYLCGYTGTSYTGEQSTSYGDDTPAFTSDQVGFTQGRSVWNSLRTWTGNDQHLWGRCATLYNATNYVGKHLTVVPNHGISSIPDSFGHILSLQTYDCRLN